MNSTSTSRFVLRSLLSLVLWFSVFGFWSFDVKAQDVRVPFDSTGRIMVIDRELETTLQLFTDVKGFVDARLFRHPDSTYSLEITHEVNGVEERMTRPLTKEQGAALIVTVTDRLKVLAPRATLDQSGQSALLWGSTIWSLIYYAPAINIALSGESSTAWTFLAAGGLGYLLPSLLTANAPVSEGAASLALGGMFQGAIHGWMLAGLIQGDNVDERLGFGLSVATGISETVAGYLIATNSNMQEGHAGVINTTMFYGGVTGLWASLATATTVNDELEIDPRVLGGVGLAGSAAGAYVGHLLGQDNSFTGGDASVYGVAGFLGGTFPLALFTAISADWTPATVFWTATGTTAAGLWAGERLVAGKDFSSATGFLLATLGGALLGAGVGALIGDERYYVATTWVGAAAGFAIVYAINAPSAEARAMRRSDRTSNDLHWNINPLGIAAIAQPGLFRGTMPLASVSWRL